MTYAADVDAQTIAVSAAGKLMNHQCELIPEEVHRRIEAAFDRQNRGEVAFAAGVYRDVLTRYPSHARALHYLGLIAQKSGNAQLAINLLERSIEIDPKDPRAYNHLGHIHICLGDRRAASACFERGLQVDPSHIASLSNLANVTMTWDLPGAISLYRRALELSPNSAVLAFNLAQALNEDRSFNEALKFYRRTIVLDSQHFHARYCLGLLLEECGQFAEALEQYLTVQKLNPCHALSLAKILGMPNIEPDVQMVRRAGLILDAPNAKDDDKISLHRGLGKHYERAGSYEQAFRHFLEAKRLFRHTRPAFNLHAAAEMLRRIMRVFDHDFFSVARTPITDSRKPVFIVGLHRSGTTLVEQIVASHPRVSGAGELQNVPKLVKNLHPGFPECMKTMDANVLVELGTGYLDAIARLAGPDTLRVTDKMPLNSLHLGLIARLFPMAYIIYCRRNPLDIAVSCFEELFELENDYTAGFEEFGQYFLEHERLMAHWQAVLPIRIHEIRYEDLVANPEATSRGLIQYCELDWHPSCLEFQKTNRAVQTPSRWQVRQPIYRSSVGRWQRYRSQMAGLIDLLNASGYRYPGDH